MRITNTQELTLLREGGAHLSRTLYAVAALVAPGVSTEELNNETEKRIRAVGAVPAFLGYTPEGADRPFPATLCVSVNDQIVHGIPNETEQLLVEGDILTIDAGLVYEGLVVDMALTVGVGVIDDTAQRLVQAAIESRDQAIAAARVGNTTGDIGHAAEEAAYKYGFTTMKDLGGHGVGRAVHEEPFIPNFGTPGTGVSLKEGMVIAIEPIVGEGKDEIRLADDGYTYYTTDGSRTAQFEHTVVVTSGEP